jgi:hypothetical protein
MRLIWPVVEFIFQEIVHVLQRDLKRQKSWLMIIPQIPSVYLSMFFPLQHAQKGDNFPQLFTHPQEAFGPAKIVDFGKIIFQMSGRL